MSVTVVDRGARRMVERAKGIKGREGVDVGVIGAEAGEVHENAEITVGELAAMFEFGIGGQKRRSWLRDWVAENEKEIMDLLRDMTGRILKGEITEQVGLARIGVWAQGSIQERIAAGIDPENAPSTIAAKGSSAPLIDFGQFRSSITHMVR